MIHGIFCFKLKSDILKLQIVFGFVYYVLQISTMFKLNTLLVLVLLGMAVALTFAAADDDMELSRERRGFFGRLFGKKPKPTVVLVPVATTTIG